VRGLYAGLLDVVKEAWSLAFQTRFRGWHRRRGVASPPRGTRRLPRTGACRAPPSDVVASARTGDSTTVRNGPSTVDSVATPNFRFEIRSSNSHRQPEERQTRPGMNFCRRRRSCAGVLGPGVDPAFLPTPGSSSSTVGAGRNRAGGRPAEGQDPRQRVSVSAEGLNDCVSRAVPR